MIRKVCSGFPKRSCSIKDLKRDDDSTQSHRALGKFNALQHYCCRQGPLTSDHAFEARRGPMTPQERQMVDDLFDRLSKMENAPRDADAAAAIAQGLRIAPNAIYPLVQTVLVQDEALKRANSRIEELESQGAARQDQGGGFLGTMRDT